MTWATDRLDAIKSGTTLPPVVTTLQLGGLDDWGDGWVRKTWHPAPALLNADGSLFGGYIAALADQMLAFAAMTVVPGDSLFRTTNLMVNFVRVGRAAPLAIESRVVATTRRLITVRAEFQRADGELVAEASAQQMIQSFAGAD